MEHSNLQVPNFEIPRPVVTTHPRLSSNKFPRGQKIFPCDCRWAPKHLIHPDQWNILPREVCVAFFAEMVWSKFPIFITVTTRLKSQSRKFQTSPSPGYSHHPPTQKNNNSRQRKRHLHPPHTPTPSPKKIQS